VEELPDRRGVGDPPGRLEVQLVHPLGNSGPNHPSSLRISISVAFEPRIAAAGRPGRGLDQFVGPVRLEPEDAIERRVADLDVLRPEQDGQSLHEPASDNAEEEPAGVRDGDAQSRHDFAGRAAEFGVGVEREDERPVRDPELPAVQVCPGNRSTRSPRPHFGDRQETRFGVRSRWRSCPVPRVAGWLPGQDSPVEGRREATVPLRTCAIPILLILALCAAPAPLAQPIEDASRPPSKTSS